MSTTLQHVIERKGRAGKKEKEKDEEGEERKEVEKGGGKMPIVVLAACQAVAFVAFVVGVVLGNADKK